MKCHSTCILFYVKTCPKAFKAYWQNYPKSVHMLFSNYSLFPIQGLRLNWCVLSLKASHRTSPTSTSAPFPRPNCRALCVTTTSTSSAHPLLLRGDQGDNVTLQKSQPGRGQRHTVHTCPHISTPFHICPHTFLEVHCCDTVGQQLVVRNTYWFRALKPTHPLF